MPVTINSPNFWENRLDEHLKRADRVPKADGSYTFENPNDVREGVLNNPETNLLPNPTAQNYRNFDARQFYNDRMWLMENEIKHGIIPYNVDRVEGDDNLDIMDAVKRWIDSGGSQRR